MNTCLICDRIELIILGNNPAFVTELESGFVVFGDYQFYPGYTLFLSKVHKQELYQLDVAMRKQFLWDMSMVAEAIIKVFSPVKLNHELLGNAESHLHWHLYPRYADDPDPKRPVWSYPKEKRCNPETTLKNSFIEKYRPLLKAEIQRSTKLY